MRKNALLNGYSHKTVSELMGNVDLRIATFDTHGADTKLDHLSGNKVVVLRELTADEYDIEEVGKMYKIRFENGFETDAFEDELTFKK